MENLSNQELSLALAINKHKIFLQRFFVFSLFFINLLILYNLWYRWIIYSSQTPGSRRDEINPNSEVNFESYHQRTKPLPITIEEYNALVSGVQRYDYYTIVHNPNTTWLASNLTVEFRFPTETMTRTVTNLLPGESRIVVVFGRPSNIAEPFLTEIRDVRWQRIHENLPVASESIVAKFPRYTRSPLSEQYAETEFMLINRSTSGFWNVPYTILLYQGNTLIGIDQSTTTRLDAGAERIMKTAWTKVLLEPNRIEIVIDPSVVLDLGNRYLPGR